MEPLILQQYAAEAERLLAQRRRQVAHQHEIVTDLERTGRNSHEARNLLRQFEACADALTLPLFFRFRLAGVFALPQTLTDHLLASWSAALLQQTALHENSQRDWKCGEAGGRSRGLVCSKARINDNRRAHQPIKALQPEADRLSR